MLVFDSFFLLHQALNPDVIAEQACQETNSLPMSTPERVLQAAGPMNEKNRQGSAGEEEQA